MRSGRGKIQNRSKYGANRAVHSVWDIGRLKPVEGEVEVVSPPKSIAELMQREQRALEAKQLAEQRERDNAARIEYDGRLAAFWSRPVAELVGRLGMRDDHCPLEACESHATAGRDFLDELTASGVVLTDGAKNRIAAYCETQNMHSHGRFGVTVENLRLARTRLQQLGVFAPGEVTEPEAEPAPPTSTRLTLAEALKQADGTDASDRRLRTAATNDFIFGEAKPMIDQWVEHLYREYDYVPSDEQRLEFFMPPNGYMHVHGLSFLDPRAYDRLRKWAVSTGRFPSHMVSAQEAVSELFQKRKIDIHQYQYLETRLTQMGLWNRSRKHADALNLIPRV
jgi:hypothetical protein